MGQREALLAGAKQCLYEKGYARTTARDIVAVSGANLAAIGYHFGSKEALLNEALMQGISEWGDEMERTLAANYDPAASPLTRFESTWTRIIESFASHRQLWVASIEILAQIERAPDVRQFLAAALQEARIGLATLFQGIDSGKDERSAQVVGSFYYALMSGMMVQWLTDPDRAPSGHDLAEALRLIASNIGAAYAPRMVDAEDGVPIEG